MQVCCQLVSLSAYFTHTNIYAQKKKDREVPDLVLDSGSSSFLGGTGAILSKVKRKPVFKITRERERERLDF